MVNNSVYRSPHLERVVLDYNGLIAQSLEDPNEGEEWIWEDKQ